jgi:hypothetical protein
VTADAYDWLHPRAESGFNTDQKPDGVFFGSHLVQYFGEDVEMAVYARPAQSSYQVSEVSDRQSLSIMRLPVQAVPQYNSRPIHDQRPERQRAGIIEATSIHGRAARRLSGWAALVLCLDAATMGISHQHVPGLAWEVGSHPIQTVENIVEIPKAVVHLGKSILDGVNKVGSLGGMLG